jgi:hypothetical protein
MVPFRTLLAGNINPPPKEAALWLAALRKYAPIAPASTARPAPRAKKGPAETEKEDKPE